MHGADKPSLIVGERPIVERQIEALRAAGIDEILVVGARKGRALPAGAHAIADAVSAGPLGGVYTALLAATCPVVIVLAGDMPFVSPELVACLADMGPAEATVPHVDGRRHPLCAAYRRRVASRLKARIDRGAWRVTDALDDLQVRDVSAADLESHAAHGMQVMNVNTPDDYREAARLAAASRPQARPSSS